MFKHIIISRTDNIGDVVLTLPMAYLLKQHYPHCKITLLARDYVRAIAESCLDIDDFLSWDQLQALPAKSALVHLQQQQADAIFHVFPHYQIARYAKQAGIPWRIGTSRRWFHYLCNKRVRFSRSKSQLHEGQLNLKLLAALNVPVDYSQAELVTMIRLDKPAPNDNVRRYLDPKKFNLVLHPLSNGNGREWPASAFCELISSLPAESFNIIVTGSKQESALLRENIIANCPDILDSSGQLNLSELVALLGACDGVVVSGTGPLHVAAGLGTRVLGLFPPKVGISVGRWGPIGQKAQTVVQGKDCRVACQPKQCACMKAIMPAQVKQVVMAWTIKHEERVV